jgi:DNA replication protein DnaC
MYITTVPNRNSRPAILLRTSYREDGKVLNKTLANLTNWDDLRIEAFNENLLIFGNPGTGKSHLSIALAREWCLRGRKCLYLTAASLVQELLIAKNKFSLNQFIKRLDRFEALIIDDISYIPYEKSESEVLFVLLAERYEQRSVVITSNLVFSKWQQIFKDEMTTNAAIDRLVHHSTILELNAESYRIKIAKGNQQNSQEQVAKKLEKQNNKKENKNVI